VAPRTHVRVGARDVTIWVNEVRDSTWDAKPAAGLVGIDDPPRGVCQEPEAEVLASGEVFVGFEVIAADTEDDRPFLAPFLGKVSEGAGFGGAADGAVFGVEVEDDPLASEVA